MQLYFVKTNYKKYFGFVIQTVSGGTSQPHLSKHKKTAISNTEIVGLH
jgi:hypothetical protein